MHLRALAVLVCGIAAPAAAADGEPTGFRDWRLSLTAVETPEVEEIIDRNVGRSVTVDWGDGDADPGVRVAIETVGGDIADGDGFVWGAGLGYTRWGLLPDRYTAEDGTAYSGSGTELEVQSLTWRWQAGWAWGGRAGRDGAWHAELLGVLGGGWALGETETFFDTDGDSIIDGSSVDRGGGPQAEAGIRGSVGIIERQVELLFTAGWTWSQAWVDVDIPGGSSQIDIDATGFDFGLSLGYRF
ncbi:MAG: hypothetical protein RLZZ127_352 [Planctomycetota bacterium]|jgi:hypothetical protein